MDAVTIPSPIPVPNGTYTETGFFYLSNSYSSDCSNPFLTYGIPVDHCIIDVGYAYKFQLVEGIYLFAPTLLDTHTNC
jgi:hypothetical protein